MRRGWARVALITALGLASAVLPDMARGRVRSRRSEEVNNSPPAPGERSAPQALPPALLTTPGYYGTLAAVRSLGRLNVPITTASPRRWTISSSSKYVSNHLSCPPTTDSERFLAWLEDFGRRQEQKHVLLPTCDDTAWLYARYRERLAAHFHVESSSIEAIHGLLHKRLLAEHARAVGLETPSTWFPESESDVLKLAEEVTFPLLVKPATQVLFEARSKGSIVERAGSLLTTYRNFRKLTHGRAILDYDPSVSQPMVQAFYWQANNGIYNIAGFAQGGRLLDARAGHKVLQRPRSLGVGLCFEEAPLDASLIDGLKRLIERVNFSGVFEAEFVKLRDRALLIDFNPRFYNQMEFEVARGLHLPALAYRNALQAGNFAPPLAEHHAQAPLTGMVFTHGSAFKTMIAAQRLSGVLSAEEAKNWQHWYASHEGQRVDAVRDSDDVWPARLDLVQTVQHHLRHPRIFLRAIVFNS